VIDNDALVYDFVSHIDKVKSEFSFKGTFMSNDEKEVKYFCKKIFYMSPINEYLDYKDD